MHVENRILGLFILLSVAHPTEIKHIIAFLTVYSPLYDVHTLMKLSWSMSWIKNRVIFVNILKNTSIFYAKHDTNPLQNIMFLCWHISIHAAVLSSLEKTKRSL
jgi:hypothetical protein